MVLDRSASRDICSVTGQETLSREHEDVIAIIGSRELVAETYPDSGGSLSAMGRKMSECLGQRTITVVYNRA